MKTSHNPTPSAGSIIKKIVTLNPTLGVQDVIDIVRECVEVQTPSSEDFTQFEVINEKKALALAAATARLL